MPSSTLPDMVDKPKSHVTVKLPRALVADAGAMARLLGKTAPEFMAECIREGIRKHTGEAKKRLDAIAKGESGSAD